ncbi:MAG: hypothetical protein D6760_13185 [Deltaproteobacteria bacterium]|nr:MAG: hypothetical protein D6760_13185 [Deltaproteobacteria bacterium]
MNKKEAIVLIGHGGVPADAPREKIAELKRLEAAREARGELRMSEREAALDAEIRNWPRTAESDPYKAGLEAVAARLERQLAPRRLVVAYNEFCAPSVEQAVADLAAEGYERILLVTTMFTPGGSHSDRELPELTDLLRRDHPGVEIEYLWPFDLDLVADFLARHIDRARSES